MAAQIRPNRMEVTDRFPMLGFTIRTDNAPRVAEVVIASDPALFTRKEGRTPSNFYSSREHGLLTIPRGEAVYVLPPEVMARFIAASRLWFGLATATPPTSNDWTIDAMPGPDSPYVSLHGLTDRALRRVRMFPGRRGNYGNAKAPSLSWAGDLPKPGTTPVAAPGAGSAPAPAGMPGAGAPQPAPQPGGAGPLPHGDAHYDDGFGPLPPITPPPVGGGGSAPAPVTPGTAAPMPAAAPHAATTAGLGFARALDSDPEAYGIDSAPYSDSDDAPQAAASALALAAAEYPLATRTEISPNFDAGRGGKTIDRIIIHIADVPTTQRVVNSFTNPAEKKSSHYLVGPAGEIVQFVSEADTAWHCKGSNQRSIGIEHVAVKVGGADYKRANGSVQHFDAQAPTQIEYEASAALVTYLCDKYHLPVNRTTIMGHREADTSTGHTACPDGNWDWDLFMRLVNSRQCLPQDGSQSLGQSLGRSFAANSRAFDGGSDTIEFRYRAFIPSPALKGPFFDNYHGDGRGFSYADGTSRGEITFLVDMAPGGGLSNLRVLDRHWSPTYSYNSSDTPAVAGKPDWWLDLVPGAVPTGTGTCPTSDDTLNAVIGATGTVRPAMTVVDGSSIVTVTMSGNNPLVAGSPAIDADMSVMLRRGANGLEAKVNGSHDGFPAHEVYVNRQRVYGYDPVAAGKGPTALFPPMGISVDTAWAGVSAYAASQSLGFSRPAASPARAFGGAGTRLVFADVAGPWHCVDYKHVKLTSVAWDTAPDQPVAFVFFGHPNIDFDGSPTAYNPQDTGDDMLSNAGDTDS